MISKIEILSDDGLECVAYDFYLLEREMKFVLNYYCEAKRQTKRHSFKAVKIWNKLDTRRNNAERPYVTNEIQQKVIDAFMRSLKFEHN